MRFKLKPLMLLFILPLLVSCADNVDFNQIQVDVDPIMDLPLVYFELDQLDFLEDTGEEVISISDITDIDVFQTSIVRDNLDRFDLIINMRKDFPRGFRVNIAFLDDNLQPTYELSTITFNENSEEIEIRENIVIAANPGILNTGKLRVEIELVPSSGNPIDPDVQWELDFRSAGIFYLSF